MRSVMKAVLLGFAVVGAAAALLFWRAAAYGAGPRDSSGAPQGQTRETALVANAVAGSVTLIDLEARRAVATFDTVPDGAKVSLWRDPMQALAQSMVEGRAGLNYAQDTDLSRDGTVLFVSRGYLGDVAAFDIASGEVLWRTPVAGLRADHMAISPDGARLYVSTLIRSGDVVEVLDTENGRRLGRVKAGRWPHDVHVSHDNEKVYVASLGDMQLEPAARGAEADAYTVIAVDPETLEVQDTHGFEAGVRPFQVTRDGTRLFAQLSNAHAVIAYDMAARRVVGRLDLPVADGVSEADWDFEAPHHGLALTPDEATLCAAGRASDYAAIIDAETLSLLATVPVGDAPSWAEATSDGGLCVVANTRSDDVSLIDLAAGREIARIPAGRGAKHVTIGEVPAAVLDALARPAP